MTEQERAERGWPSFERVERMKQVSPGVWVPATEASATTGGPQAGGNLGVTTDNPQLRSGSTGPRSASQVACEGEHGGMMGASDE